MKKSKVLLIEDEDIVSKLIVDFLSQHSYEVTAFPDGSEALEYVRSHGLPHIVLLDLNLPAINGFEIASSLKAMADVPIIFVTSSNDTNTIVQGLKKYAEDFIVKPFELQELEARLRLVLSRMPSLVYVRKPIIQVDEYLEIDFAHSRIILMNNTINITPTESRLLHVLFSDVGRVVENRVLLARVWPGETVYEDTLRVHMHRLRRKLEIDSHRYDYIHTERGFGYSFTLSPLQHVDNHNEAEA